MNVIEESAALADSRLDFPILARAAFAISAPVQDRSVPSAVAATGLSVVALVATRNQNSTPFSKSAKRLTLRFEASEAGCGVSSEGTSMSGSICVSTPGSTVAALAAGAVGMTRGRSEILPIAPTGFVTRRATAAEELDAGTAALTARTGLADITGRVLTTLGGNAAAAASGNLMTSLGSETIGFFLTSGRRWPIRGSGV